MFDKNLTLICFNNAQKAGQETQCSDSVITCRVMNPKFSMPVPHYRCSESRAWQRSNKWTNRPPFWELYCSVSADCESKMYYAVLYVVTGHGNFVHVNVWEPCICGSAPISLALRLFLALSNLAARIHWRGDSSKSYPIKGTMSSFTFHQISVSLCISKTYVHANFWIVFSTFRRAQTKLAPK